jgi:hypothetical protein
MYIKYHYHLYAGLRIQIRIVYKSWIPIRIRVKSWIRTIIKVKIQKLYRLRIEPWTLTGWRLKLESFGGSLKRSYNYVYQDPH